MNTQHQDDPRDILTARAVRVPLDPASPDPSILLSAASIIRRGGIVAYPTETFYGLAADPFSRDAVERLSRLKGRATTGQPLILLLARAGAALDLASVTGVTRAWYDELGRAFWPGPSRWCCPRGAACGARPSAGATRWP